MSAAATVWAWGQPNLMSDERLLLLALADDANHRAQCWPSRAMLTARTGLREELIAASLQTLRERGLIDTSAPKDGKPTEVFLRLDHQLEPKIRATALLPAEKVFSGTQAELMEEALRLYNALAVECDLSKVRKLTPDLKVKLAKRLEDTKDGLDSWMAALHAIRVSGHCRGINDRGWKASFAFMLQAESYGKLLNGYYEADYDEKSAGGTRSRPSGRGDQRLDGIRSFDRAVREGHSRRKGQRGGVAASEPST